MPHLEKRKNGWLATVKYRGERHRKQLRTRAMADQWARNTLDRLKLGKQAEEKSITVALAVDQYLHKVGCLQSDSGRTRRESNARTIKKLIGKYRLNQLSADLLIDEYVQPRLQKVSPDTVRRELSLISQALSSQCRGDHTIQSLVPSLRSQLFQQRKLAPPARRDRRLSSAELIRLLRACPIPLRYIVWLTVQTGLRRSELSELRLQEIKDKTLLVAKTKTARPRFLPLSEKSLTLIKLLQKTKQHQSKQLTPYTLLIPYAPRTISKYFKEACDRAGIEDFHFHDLRAEAAHRMLEGRIYKRKCTIDEVAQILGNSVRVLEKHYANHYRFTDLV